MSEISCSSFCWIPFSEVIILASGATGLPLFDGDQSVGVPCRCKGVGEGVRRGDVGRAKGPRSQDSTWLAVFKRGSTGRLLVTVTAKARSNRESICMS